MQLPVVHCRHAHAAHGLPFFQFATPTPQHPALRPFLLTKDASEDSEAQQALQHNLCEVCARTAATSESRECLVAVQDVNVWPDTDTEDDFEERRNLQAPLSEAKASLQIRSLKRDKCLRCIGASRLLLTTEQCWEDSAQPTHGWTDKGNPGSLQAGQPVSGDNLSIFHFCCHRVRFARHP